MKVGLQLEWYWYIFPSDGCAFHIKQSNWLLEFTILYFSGLYICSAVVEEQQQWYYLTHSWEDKGVRTFPKGICPKLNTITWLEFELACYNSAVQCFLPLHHKDTPLLLSCLALFLICFYLYYIYIYISGTVVCSYN